MLFARFLAENHLLIEPEMGVAVTLDECEELAKEEGVDKWALAARYAHRMLPQVFRPDLPVFEVRLAREHRLKLEGLVEGLPAGVFTATDSLGWVYQFWQSRKKAEVNRSEVKIGAGELPPVTQALHRALHGGLPPRQLNVACSGLAPNATKEQWTALAELAASAGGMPPERDLFGVEDTLLSAPLRNSLDALHELFGRAPELGSLIDPHALKADLFRSDFESVRALFAAALERERMSDEQMEHAVAARGMARAAELLAGRYHLVITNVPYLARGRQGEALRAFCRRHYPDAKNDLATVFLERCLELCVEGGAASLVLPQNWLFLTGYRKLREKLLKTRTRRRRVVPLPDRSQFSRRNHERQKSSWKNRVAHHPDEKTPRHHLPRRDIRQERGNGGTGRDGTPPGHLVLLLIPRIPRCGPAHRSNAQGHQRHVGEGPLRSRPLDRSSPEKISPRPPQPVLRRSHPMDLPRPPLRIGGLGRDREADRPRPAPHRSHRAPGRRRPPVGLPRQLHNMSAHTHSLRKMRGFLAETVCGSSSLPVRISRTRQRSSWPVIPAEAGMTDFLGAYSRFDRGNNGSSDLCNNRATAGPPNRTPAWSWPTSSASGSGVASPCTPSRMATASSASPRYGASPPPASGSCSFWPSRSATPGATACSPACSPRPAAPPSTTGSATASSSSIARGSTTAPSSGTSGTDASATASALVSYHKLAEGGGKGRRCLEALTWSYLGDWITRQQDGVKRGEAGAEDRLAAAFELRKRLAAILEGEPPHDLFIRWKPIEAQPVGWEPDADDGVCLNLRPFLAADLPGGKKGAGILRSKPNVHWRKDRGREPFRDQDRFPWFWRDGEFTGERVNDVHLTITSKRIERGRVEEPS